MDEGISLGKLPICYNIYIGLFVCVAKYIGVNMYTWHTHAHTHTHTHTHTVSEDLTLYPESQAKQFLTFLTRANRYPSLLMGGDTTAQATRKIVLVEVSTRLFLSSQ